MNGDIDTAVVFFSVGNYVLIWRQKGWYTRVHLCTGVKKAGFRLHIPLHWSLHVVTAVMKVATAFDGRTNDQRYELGLLLVLKIWISVT
jgi:hypothetical protein